MRHSILPVMGLLLVLTAGCYAGSHAGPWELEEMIVPGNLPREQHVKIWSGDTVFRWHAVIYTRDSITGIPYTMPVTCDSCRIALARSAVDSIRVGNPKGPRDNRADIAYMVLIVIGSALVP